MFAMFFFHRNAHFQQLPMPISPNESQSCDISLSWMSTFPSDFLFGR
jgi:hypothetical protein